MQYFSSGTAKEKAGEAGESPDIADRGLMFLISGRVDEMYHVAGGTDAEGRARSGAAKASA